MTDLWHNYDSFVTDIWLFYVNDSFVTDLWQIYDRFMRLAGPTFNKSTQIIDRKLSVIDLYSGWNIIMEKKPL